MRNIILIFTLFLCAEAFACKNLIPLSEAQRAINGEARAGEKSCEDLPGEQCLCFDGVTWEGAILSDVMMPDATKPIHEAKSLVEDCTTPTDDPLTTEVDESTLSQENYCIYLESKKDCKSQSESHFAVRLLDNSEVYCTRLMGYELKVSGLKKLEIDQSKLDAFKATRVQEKNLAVAIQAERDESRAGDSLFYLIKVKNKSRLTPAQRKQMRKDYRDILNDLRDGELCEAKNKILAITPDGTLIRAQDVTEIVQGN